MLDCFKDDIEQITVRINAATRSCHTLLDGQGGATELIEPSGRVVSHLLLLADARMLLAGFFDRPMHRCWHVHSRKKKGSN